MDYLKAQAARAGEAARHLGSAASAAARGAAARAAVVAGGSAALSAVGTTLTVSGKHYVVDSLLAEGGFGSVYAVIPAEEAARDKEGGGGGVSTSGASKKLVLKRMFAGSPELVAQLTAEVRLMQQLNGHPNIVAVLGAESRRQGEGADILVLMELCPGGHLLNRMNQLREAKRTLTLPKILEVFVQIVRPIAHMHACTPPIAHRDIKVRRGGVPGARPPPPPPPTISLFNL
jgi:serine/threonine protein kinase